VYLRTAVFQMDYKDVQLNTFNGLGFFISNQASARSQGVEIEGEWYIAPGYMLHGGYTYNEATYGSDTATAALRDQQITNAPKNSVVLGFDIDQPIGANTLTASINARYQSRVNTGANLAPQKEQDAYAVLNARIGMRFANQIQVSLWAKNLTNRYRNLVIFDTTVQTGSFNGYPDLPRMWGLEVRKDF
jgi:outer membrane receptor protein involved in Fe transport